MTNRRHAMYTPVVTVGVLQNAGSNQTDIVIATTGSVFVAQSPEQFTHDAKGHLTPDTVWAYSYDHADGLGSVSEATTNGGFTVESYTYDVYGTPTIYNASGSVISAPSTGNRLLFTGRDRDPTTTLYNYRYHYYSPSLGRFVQVDPLNIYGWDLNLYRYVVNSPTRFIDPIGLMWFDPDDSEWWGTVIGTAIGAAGLIAGGVGIFTGAGTPVAAGLIVAGGAAFTAGLAALLGDGPGVINPIDAALPPGFFPVGEWLLPPYGPSTTNSPPSSPCP